MLQLTKQEAYEKFLNGTQVDVLKKPIHVFARCARFKRADKNTVVFKKLPKHSTLAGKKLYVHSEDGHVVLAFGGEMQSTPCIAILNYADAPAKDIAQHLMTLLQIMGECSHPHHLHTSSGILWMFFTQQIADNMALKNSFTPQGVSIY
jgi:hypothetical protein